MPNRRHTEVKVWLVVVKVVIASVLIEIALGVDHNIEYWEADAHGKWARADEIPRRFVLDVDGLEARSPDDDITGHKKRARQRFYRNRDWLQEAGEVADV